MTIETLMQGLIEALTANTAALQAANGAKTSAAAPAPAKPAPAAAPAPAKPAPAAAKPAPAAKAPAKPAAPDISDKMAKAREELKKVLDAKGSNEVRDLLSTVGAAKLSEVGAETIDQLLENIAAALNGGEGALFE